MTEEQKDHQYFSFRETYLSRRKVVAPWMLSVCEFFNLHSTTAHAAIAYLDRLQPNEKFTRVQWKMAAICCIVIASKYNECEDHVPELRKLEEIARQQIPNEILLDYELWALMRMGWKLNARTPMAFAHCHMIHNQGVLKGDDVLLYTGGDADAARSDTQKTLNAMIESMAATCLLNTEYKGYLASDVAKAIVYVARGQLDNLVSPVWTATLDADIGQVSLGPVVEIISRLKADLLQSLPSPPQQSASGTSTCTSTGMSSLSPTAVSHEYRKEKEVTSPTSVHAAPAAAAASSACTPLMGDLYVTHKRAAAANWGQDADKENYFDHLASNRASHYD
jgi:hypothetical protein